MAHPPSFQCYRSGCGHPQCREFVLDYARNRRRQIAYGRPTTTLVDAEHAREHARRLLDLGWTVRDLQTRAASNINGLLYGNPVVQRITAQTERDLLAIPLELIPTSKRVCADGTRRRVQALCLLGHPLTWQAQKAGIYPGALAQILNGTNAHIAARAAVNIRDLHKQYWDTPAPDTGVARRVRNLAAAKGWLPTAAYDDDHLDLPETELQAAINRQVADMNPQQLAAAHYDYARLGDRSPLIVAAHRAHRRAKKAQGRRQDTVGRYQTAA